MMIAPWDEIKGKIRSAYQQIESAYTEHVVSAVDKVKGRPMLNAAVKTALPFIPIIGPTLSALYDNIGGGTKSEEDKAKQILEFLGKLEQQDKEGFDRIAQDLETNRHAIIDAMVQNRIEITDLISKSSTQMLQAIGDVKENTGVILERVTVIEGGIEKIQSLLVKERSTPGEIKRPPKPPRFHSESNVFFGRKEDILRIKQYLAESNAPICIVGEGGIGKSALAFKAIHECEDMFDVIIPIYFESLLTFNSFLLEMAMSLQLPVTLEQFERLENIQYKSDIIKGYLAGYRRVLVYADNYETVRNSIDSESSLAGGSSRQQDGIMINRFLRGVPQNSSVILTSQRRHNLTGERVLELEGLSVEDGRDLFIKVAGEKLPRILPTQVRKDLEEISIKTGGHPLSIEILASTNAENLVTELSGMLADLGMDLVNPDEEEGSRHKSLESCFEYSISKLSNTHRVLLPMLAVMFRSPFPGSAVEQVFGADNITNARVISPEAATPTLRDLYNASLLRRIDFDQYGDYEGRYRVYHFHPSLRNYLERKLQLQEHEIKEKLEDEYGNLFSMFYGKIIKETLSSIGTKDHVLSLTRFNAIISQGTDNDFERAVDLAKDRVEAGAISSDLGEILYTLGRYAAALEYYNKALAIHEELQDKIGMAKDYSHIGVVLYYQGSYNQALNYHNKALVIHEEREDKERMTVDYRCIGLVFYSQHEHSQALEYHIKALNLSKELQNDLEMAKCYNNIGLVLEDQGKHEEALEYHIKALNLSENRKDWVEAAKDHRNIGLVLNSQGKHEEALEHLNKSLEIHEELQDKIGMARDYANIGLVVHCQGKHEEALDYDRKALAIHEELEDKVGMARDYQCLGFQLGNIRKYDEAIEHYSNGLEVLEKLEEKTGYHHPLTDEIQGQILQLQNQREDHKVE